MPSTKYVRVTCWCASASAAQSASWNSLSPYWMLGPGPTWATEVKGLLLALKTSVVWYLKTVPLVPPPRTRDSELLLAGHHVSYGILVGTLKSRGRLVYFVIPLLLFLWRFPSSSILDLPNRRAIWWLHSQRTDRKPVGDLWVTRRGDHSAHHPDLGVYDPSDSLRHKGAHTTSIQSPSLHLSPPWPLRSSLAVCPHIFGSWLYLS